MTSIVRELTALQERDGWLSESGLRDLAARMGVPLHRLESVSTFYTHFRRTPPKRVTVDVCRDLSCVLAGRGDACVRLRRALTGRDDVEICEVSCLGRCDSAPAAAIGHRTLALERTEEVLEAIDRPGPRADAGPAKNWGEADVCVATEDRYGTLRLALEGDGAALADTLDARFGGGGIYRRGK